ncbi:putrescine-binding periplasmic protein [Marinobacterium nitratireducens]|uniref:Putrescine-binding periplasmic protein n=1 Tax=Marinobacterium nitratireducens TaxID=518897 RepID=A0A917ZIE0_9GAMM|nr:polyamine ABC transporter substrate-binding protein [Marinobacterium nitratireducens]GGO83221.1 putrescine-binding periplasmic protein [Marinobacterium nitratireducens]
MKSWSFGLKAVAAALALGAAAQVAAQEELHVYNWSDYIAEDTLERFQQETGIKVLYDVYDSNEVLEAKLLAGHSGYDLIFPTARPFADRQLKAGILQPVNKEALTHYANLDPVILGSLGDIDEGHNYLVPYMWGTTGIGINVAKVREVLGDDAELDSWGLIFDPEVSAKLAGCGISLMDDPTEVLIAARAYLGKDPNDFSSEALDEAAAVINAARPNIRYFHSSQYINDLANGDLCVAHGYSGDVLQARDRADEAGNGVEIAYLVPTEGAVVWTDVMAIPSDAPNPQAAQKFIDFLLRPDVIAPITNYVAYANANAAATELVDEDIRQDPGIYPPQATRERFITPKTPSNRETKSINRLWTRIKTGQ